MILFIKHLGSANHVLAIVTIQIIELVPMPLEKSLYLIRQNEKDKDKRHVSGEESTIHPGRASLILPESSSLLPRNSETDIWRLVMRLLTSQL